MRRWPVIVAGCAATAAALAVAAVQFGWFREAGPARAEPVPDGDQEIAWLHTTTSGDTWELFVLGLKRAALPRAGSIDGIVVDDSNAFPPQTTAVPEVVIRRNGFAGRLHIRWYKLTTEADEPAWVAALAARTPAPLAVIGGFSSDRAIVLARAMTRRSNWAGERPLLFISNATADDTPPADPDNPEQVGDQSQAKELIDLYPGRSFRFCFTNRQMAEAVADFVVSDPTLRPGPNAWPALRMTGTAAAGPWAVTPQLADLARQPTVFSVAWDDDPYSGDLYNKFNDALFARLTPPPDPGWTGPPANGPRFVRDQRKPIPFSIGNFYQANAGEAAAVREIVRQLPPTDERSLLVVPTVGAPARRLLLALAERVPAVGRRIVALNGDGISVNTILRDAEFAWPSRQIPIPLVLFTHHNPFGWDKPGDNVPDDCQLPSQHKTTTEDVLFFADMGRVIAAAAFLPPPAGTEARLVGTADRLAAGLKGLAPAVFDPRGNRLGGSGEHVVVLRPAPRATTPSGIRREAVIEAYTRGSGRPWLLVGSTTVGPDPTPGTRGPE